MLLPHTSFICDSFISGARCTAHITRFINVLYFYWDTVRMTYHAKTGIYVTHLSQKSPYVILNQLMYAATCLRPVEVVVNKEEIAVRLPSRTYFEGIFILCFGLA